MVQRTNPRRDGLSHCKSTSSVYSKHESIDPEVARQYAQTAAVLAFARANAGGSADNGLSRNNSHQERPRMSHEDSSSVGEIERPVRRQQSVRFVGPNAIQRRQAIGTRASQNSIVPKASNASLRPRAVTTDAPVPAQYRPPSRSSSIGKASIGRGTNASFVTALAYDEYYTREDDVASTPSSYRKIRKSKSMFSPLKAPSVFYTNGTPNSRFSKDEPTLAEQTPQESAPSGQVRLRAPKSMSFLRGGRDHVLPSTRQRNDVAVQVARDKYLHDVEQQRLRAQPSFLFRSRKAREGKPFRQSVRSSSNGYGNPVASSNSPTSPKESGLKGKARRASEKIKTKLWKVFGTSPKIKEGIMIPYQQVEASTTHVRKYNGDAEGMNDSFLNIPYPDKATVFRVTSHLPAVHAAPSDQQLRSAAGSVRSVRSDSIADEKSRVTSWAGSSNSNTISSLARAQNEADRYEQQRLSSHTRVQVEADRREQQRLSVINEHGTHHSSAAFARRPVANQHSAYPVIPCHRPSKSAGHNPAPLPGPVDSARLCSALMKRLDENSPQAKLAASRKNSADSFAEKSIPPRTSSVDRYDRNRSRGRTPATIRQVPTEDSRIIETGDSGGSGRSVQHHPQYVSSEEIYSTPAENQFSHSSGENRQWATAVSAHGIRGRGRDDVFSLDRTSNNKNNGSIGCDHTQTDSKASDLSRKQSTRSDCTARSTEEQARIAGEQLLLDQGWSPQEIAILNEPIIPPRPAEVKRRGLRESRSTFFGSSAMTLPRTESPYRRALAEADFDYNVTVVAANPPVRMLNPLKNPLLLTDEDKVPVAAISEDEERQRVYSESIYSCTTSGKAPTASTSNLALHMGTQNMIPFANSGPREILSPEDRQRLYSESAYSKWSQATSNPTPAGSASSLPLTTENKRMAPFINTGVGDVVLFDQTVYRPSNPVEGHYTTSSGGSNDWKGWMSSQVAVLERPKDNDSTPTIATHQPVNYALPSMPRSYNVAHGHRRENAQINDDDTEILQRKVSDMKQPVGILQQGLAQRHLIGKEHVAEEAVCMPEEADRREDMPQRNISNFINDLRMQGGPHRQCSAQNIINVSKQSSPAGAFQHRNVPFLKPILKNRSDTSLIEENTISKSTIPTPPPMPSRSPLRQTQNKGSIGSRTPTSVKSYAIAAGSISTGADCRNKLHKRNTSQGTLRSADTPAKSLRSNNGSQVTLKIFEVPTMGGKLVKRNSSQEGRTPVCGRENEKYGTESEESMEFGGAREDWGNGGERVDGGVEKLDAQQLGSKRMVDLFLSSRRRRITGSEESAPNGGAFL